MLHCFAAPPHNPAIQELAEMKSSLTNLQTSLTSLSSEQQKTGESITRRFHNLSKPVHYQFTVNFKLHQ